MNMTIILLGLFEFFVLVFEAMVFLFPELDLLFELFILLAKILDDVIFFHVLLLVKLNLEMISIIIYQTEINRFY